MRPDRSPPPAPNRTLSPGRCRCGGGSATGGCWPRRRSPWCWPPSGRSLRGWSRPPAVTPILGGPRPAGRPPDLRPRAASTRRRPPPRSPPPARARARARARRGRAAGRTRALRSRFRSSLPGGTPRAISTWSTARRPKSLDRPRCRTWRAGSPGSARFPAPTCRSRSSCRARAGTPWCCRASTSGSPGSRLPSPGTPIPWARAAAAESTSIPTTSISTRPARGRS